MDGGKVFHKGSMAIFACSMETRLSTLNEEVQCYINERASKKNRKGVRILKADAVVLGKARLK